MCVLYVCVVLVKLRVCMLFVGWLVSRVEGGKKEERRKGGGTDRVNQNENPQTEGWWKTAEPRKTGSFFRSRGH